MTRVDFSNPDRILLGARAAGYKAVSNTTVDGLFDHEARIGRRVHLGMAFERPGLTPLSRPQDVALVNRDDTALIQCWKPVRRWRDATGNNKRASEYFAKVATSIRDAGGNVIMVIHHEPENDVDEAGSVVEYRAMWRHVRQVFADNGASPLWGIGYMNYPKWDYLVPQMIPDDGVDWVWFNAYGSPGRGSWSENVGRFVDKFGGVLPTDGVSWGVREWGTRGGSEDDAIKYFQEATRHVEAVTFPLVKAHVVFDSPGTHVERELRISVDALDRPAPAKEEAYRQFAQLSVFDAPAEVEP